MTKYNTIYKDSDELLERLRAIKHIALDMDGTIYNGKTLFHFTIPFLKSVRELGLTYSFLTNNPSKSIPDYLSHLAKMGITADRSEMYTSAQATIDYIRLNYPTCKKLFLLGTTSMIHEFESAGFISVSETEEPDIVVVGFDKTLIYSRLCKASWWVVQGKPYIATNPDRVCPTDEESVWVDCGAICAAIEYATLRKPDIVLGKPDQNMLTGILDQRGLQPHEIAMVGDRVYTDIAMAHRAGALGVLVLSGETTLEVGESVSPRPEIIADDLKEFGEMLLKAHSAF